jgi:hypothetical protein
MKRILPVTSILCLLVFSGLLIIPSFTGKAQVTSTITRRVRRGSSLPATCTAASSYSDVFIKSGASAGMYFCSATNTWSGPFAVGGATGTLTSITGLNDTNDNELFKFVATTNAVNELTLTNAATGGTVALTTTGGDTNIPLSVVTKGSGTILFGTASDATSYFQIAQFGALNMFTSNVKKATLTGAGGGGTGFVRVASDGQFAFNSDVNMDSGAIDTGLKRTAAGVVGATNGSTGGGALQATGASRPTCDATSRGAMWSVQSGAGVGDIFQVCLKGTADSYAWRDVFTAP